MQMLTKGKKGTKEKNCAAKFWDGGDIDIFLAQQSSLKMYLVK